MDHQSSNSPIRASLSETSHLLVDKKLASFEFSWISYTFGTVIEPLHSPPETKNMELVFQSSISYAWMNITAIPGSLDDFTDTFHQVLLSTHLITLFKVWSCPRLNLLPNNLFAGLFFHVNMLYGIVLKVVFFFLAKIEVKKTVAGFTRKLPVTGI